MSVQNKFSVGDKVKYVGSGWGETFKRDIEYPVTEIWSSGCDVDGNPVSNRYYNDFELVKDTPKAQDNSWYENGELPPINTTCEATEDGEWKEVKILAHTVAMGFDVAVYQHGDEVSYSSPCRFRPIKSPEQIAKQEREKVIEDIARVISSKISDKRAAESLYELGYRKMGEIENE